MMRARRGAFVVRRYALEFSGARYEDGECDLLGPRVLLPKKSVKASGLQKLGLSVPKKDVAKDEL